MIHHFKEPFSKASLWVGDYLLLESYISEKQLKGFTFISAVNETLKLLIDKQPIMIKSGEMISLTPTQHLQYIKGGGSVIYQFNSDFYCIKDHDKEVNCMGVIFFSNIPNPIITLNEIEIEKLNYLHQDIIEEFEDTDTIQAEMLRVLIKNFIIRATRLLKKQQSSTTNISSKQDLLRKFNILVEEHFKTEHQVSFYADRLFKAPKTLSNNFHVFNTSQLQIIQERIILEAKRLLTYSDGSFKEIAHQLGYSDAAQLSKLFKKHVGISPSKFKKGKIDIS